MFSVISPLPAAHQISLQEWQPKVGDRFVVDTKANEGYLLHPDGEYVAFPVITGQRRTVRYIGLTYFAATPNWDWNANEKGIKGDRVTFGPQGRIIRLYKDGEVTNYGIHEHAAEEVMFARESRYQSMGCIIVRHPIMDILEKTYDLNAETGFPVLTRAGVDDPVQVAFSTTEGTL